MKQERRQRATRIANDQMMADVPDAEVVIVNPTHYAVALKWSREPGAAPACVAKGVDHVAQAIRDRALEAGVPVRQDPPTARALFATTEIGAGDRAGALPRRGGGDPVCREMRRKAGHKDDQLRPRRAHPSAARTARGRANATSRRRRRLREALARLAIAQAMANRSLSEAVRAAPRGPTCSGRAGSGRKSGAPDRAGARARPQGQRVGNCAAPLARPRRRPTGGCTRASAAGQGTRRARRITRDATQVFSRMRVGLPLSAGQRSWRATRRSDAATYRQAHARPPSGPHATRPACCHR